MAHEGHTPMDDDTWDRCYACPIEYVENACGCGCDCDEPRLGPKICCDNSDCRYPCTGDCNCPADGICDDNFCDYSGEGCCHHDSDAGEACCYRLKSDDCCHGTLDIWPASYGQNKCCESPMYCDSNSTAPCCRPPDDTGLDGEDVPGVKWGCCQNWQNEEAKLYAVDGSDDHRTIVKEVCCHTRPCNDPTAFGQCGEVSPCVWDASGFWACPRCCSSDYSLNDSSGPTICGNSEVCCATNCNYTAHVCAGETCCPGVVQDCDSDCCWGPLGGPDCAGFDGCCPDDDPDPGLSEFNINNKPIGDPESAQQDPHMPDYIPFFTPEEKSISIRPNQQTPNPATKQIKGINRYLLPDGRCVEMDCYPDCEFPQC